MKGKSKAFCNVPCTFSLPLNPFCLEFRQSTKIKLPRRKSSSQTPRPRKSFQHNTHIGLLQVHQMKKGGKGTLKKKGK
uniref:Uncharacterized protein n=1 Tax=Nelumbo nucifera TaxID=4432 RepID=A0A822ZKS8_NELNU|nr:TPA_asm: hypothetical protein HUJ06_001836 [Nelumbo nucifera]